MQRFTRNNIATTMYLKEEKFRGNSGENELTNLHTCVECDRRGERIISLTNDFVIVV